jgi:hypothetical protein
VADIPGLLLLSSGHAVHCESLIGVRRYPGRWVRLQSFAASAVFYPCLGSLSIATFFPGVLTARSSSNVLKKTTSVLKYYFEYLTSDSRKNLWTTF